jgi:hypothetical protein
MLPSSASLELKGVDTTFNGIALSFQGFIFKLGPTFEKDIAYLSEENKWQIRWHVLKQWYAMLSRATSHLSVVHEYSKLPVQIRDELFIKAMTYVMLIPTSGGTCCETLS